QKESQKADEYLREIKDQKLLPEAVGQCIEAAGYELEPDTQKSLLRAASFGKCFIDKFPPESFVRMCQDLRVLNAVRDYQIGIPLTFTQYPPWGGCRIWPGLVLRRLYPLAIRICEYLRLSEIQGVSRILAHWACYKVQQKDKSDEEVAQAINQKLGDTPGISYSEIAARAYDCGRTELAIKVWWSGGMAGGGGSHVLVGMGLRLGHLRLPWPRRSLCPAPRWGGLGQRAPQGPVGRAGLGGHPPGWRFAAQATEDQIKLLRLQRHLQEDLDKPYLDLSLHDTVSNLILDGHHKRAEQLYREFKIPDKRYWWLKISALATRGDWEEMEKFSKSKKSPIGYLPFVEISVKHHNRYEAKKYAPRVTPEQRVKAFVLVGDLDQAADAAIEHKNETEMNLVLSKCTAGTDAAVAEKLNRARAQLLKK
ncbi:VPS16 protein, partial [Nyctibius bracteatus]|nr:VPS16 protein [Nyctibius bracteatus]